MARVVGIITVKGVGQRLVNDVHEVLEMISKVDILLMLKLIARSLLSYSHMGFDAKPQPRTALR